MEKAQFVITIPIYDGVDLMDIAAPREIFSWASNELQELKVYFVGEADDRAPSGLKQVTTRDKLLITPDVSFSDPEAQNPDLLWVPGGSPDALQYEQAHLSDALMTYIAEKGKTVPWLTSVCEGAILLAKLGFLDGYEVTTHHSFYACMKAFPKVKMVADFPRYVKDRNRITGGGISAGLDMAFYIVELIQGTQTAMAAQSTMQYYPVPPIQSSIVPSNCCPIKGMIPLTEDCK
ncbi:MAG: DJ-1/PfpI family protein [Bacteroidota bacterium]